MNSARRIYQSRFDTVMFFIFVALFFLWSVLHQWSRAIDSALIAVLLARLIWERR